MYNESKFIKNKDLFNKILNAGGFSEYYNDKPIYKEEVLKDAFLDKAAPVNDIPKSFVDTGKVMDDGSKVYTYEMPVYNAPAPEPAKVQPTPFNRTNKTPGWMLDTSGVVHDFNRGLLMYGPDGREVIDIFDGTSKHHAPQTHYLAREEFGVEFEDSGTPMLNATRATDEGLAIVLLEGAMAQIYIPNNITNEQIVNLMQQMKARELDGFTYYLIQDGGVVEIDGYEDLGLDEGELTYELLQDFMDNLYDKSQELDEKNDEKMTASDYVNTLLRFVEANDTNVLDYYREIATRYIRGVEPTDFEHMNPFLSDEDISRLINSDDENIVEYFARAMTRVIELNMIDLGLIEARDDENQEVISREEITQEIENEFARKLTPEEYVIQLVRYSKENNIGITTYFLNLAINYRKNGRNADVPEFERMSPFLSDKDINLLINSTEDDIESYFAMSMAMVIDFNLDAMREAKINDQDEKQEDNESTIINKPHESFAKISPEQYIQELLSYMDERNITAAEYYYALAYNYRNNNEFVPPMFELRNPFLNERDLERILSSTDPEFESYFAMSMAMVIDFNLDEMSKTNDDTLTREDIDRIVQQQLDDIEETITPVEEEHNKIDTNYNELDVEELSRIINEKLDSLSLDDEDTNNDELDSMLDEDVRDDRKSTVTIFDDINISNIKMDTLNVYTTGDTTHIYTLANGETSDVKEFNSTGLDTGEYVNIFEYVYNIIDTMNNKYGNMNIDQFVFVTSQGNPVGFHMILNQALEQCKNAGAIKLGKEYSSREFTYFSDLEELFDGSYAKFAGKKILKGYYVRRDVLDNFFKNYKAKVVRFDDMDYNRVVTR